MEKSSHRTEKINQLIMQEVGKMILRETEIGKNAFLTITKVKTSQDMQNTDIYVSVLQKGQEKSAMEELRRNTYDIQRMLNRTLRMSFVPKISFMIDELYEKENRIYEILDADKKNS